MMRFLVIDKRRVITDRFRRGGAGLRVTGLGLLALSLTVAPFLTAGSMMIGAGATIGLRSAGVNEDASSFYGGLTGLAAAGGMAKSKSIGRMDQTITTAASEKLAGTMLRLTGPLEALAARLSVFTWKLASEAGEVRLGTGERIALGIEEHLDAFAKNNSAITWKNFSKNDPLNWKLNFHEAMNSPNNKILFNLDDVDVWAGITRASRGSGGATDWEFLQIRQNPQWWERIACLLHRLALPAQLLLKIM